MKRILFWLAGPSQEPGTFIHFNNPIVGGLVTSDHTPWKSFIQSPGRVPGINLLFIFVSPAGSYLCLPIACLIFG